VTTVVPQIYFLSISMIFHHNRIHHPHTSLPGCPYVSVTYSKMSFLQVWLKETTPLQQQPFLKP